MIRSSLSLITHALSRLDIRFPSTIIDVPPQSPPVDTSGNRFLPLTAEPNISQTGNQLFEMDGASQVLEFQNFDLDNFDISPEMLDAFSALEPIDATVGALYDFS